MKYIEELVPGDIFVSENHLFILTIDFKKNGSRLCVSLINGQPKWMNSDSIVHTEQLYKLDNNNNITPIKEFRNEYSKT